jgi:hypothetical protein
MTRIACVLTGCEVINQQDTRLAPSSASTLQAASCTQPEEGESQQEACKGEEGGDPEEGPESVQTKRAARSGSKSEKVLELMKRKEGATLAEIAKATGWQNHSIRGFVSGHAIKKLGLKVELTKGEAGERTYRIVG